MDVSSHRLPIPSAHHRWGMAFFLCLAIIGGIPHTFGQSLDQDIDVEGIQNKGVEQNMVAPSATDHPQPPLKEPGQNPYLTQPQQSNQITETPPGSNRKPFQLKAVQSYQLPPEMYGQWAVTATLLKTNLPGNYPTVVNDIWQFEQSGETVSLSNPNTGAFATIHVDRVQRNWATFHHRVVLKDHRKYLLEQPSIQVSGDRMLGKTTHTYIYMHNGTVEKTYQAVFRIDATRLTDSRVLFEHRPSLNDTDFEVSDIQQEFEGQTPETTDSNLYTH